MPNVVDKPWGREIILTSTDLPYTGKILEVKKGTRWSLQYHDQKTETIVLIQGKANLVLGNNQTDINPQDMIKFQGYTIFPGQIHRVEAISDSLLVEISTPENGTTFRLKDDYDRISETPDIRNSPNRGWGTS